MSKEIAKMFENKFFDKCPALRALEYIQEPKPEHIRACLLELTRYLLKQHQDDQKQEQKLNS
jgi:hypothetical protein